MRGSGLDRSFPSLERGVHVTLVHPDSPAAQAGLRVNDVVTHWDGRPVASGAEIARTIGRNVDHRYRVTFRRGHEQRETFVTTQQQRESVSAAA